MKVIGNKITCMDKDCINGLTGVSMKEVIYMIRKMGLVCIHTLTAVVTKVSGRMANNTVKVFSSVQKASHAKVSGKTEKDCIGQMRLEVKSLSSNNSTQIKK